MHVVLKPSVVLLAAVVMIIVTAAFLWPKAVPTEASGVIAVDGGSGHTCALTGEGGVKCWGIRGRGRLGDGVEGWGNAVPPVDVVGLTSNVASFAASGIHTCAVTTGGAVNCWGYNQNGQLGDGTTTDRFTPVNVVGLTSGIQSVTAAYGYTCAVTDGGGVKCWGSNALGLLGFAAGTRPGDVVGLTTGVAALAAGDAYTCALTTSGGVKCWGVNNQGQLGDGTTCDPADSLSQCLICRPDEKPQCDGVFSTIPVDVVGLTSGVESLAAGASHVCALTDAGGVNCWGSGRNGQLGALPWPDCGGIINEPCSTIPVVIGGLESGVTAIAAGNSHTCALMVGGGVKCWGQNANGQLGDGTTADSGAPVDVVGLSDVVSIGAGDSHTCAVRKSGGVACWGYNQAGKLGDGTTTDSAAPVGVIGLGAKPIPTPCPPEGCRTPTATPTPTISISSLLAVVGEEAKVNVLLSDIAFPGLGAWSIDVFYEPSVVSAITCTAEKGGICHSQFASNRVRFFGASSGGIRGTALLASIVFECKSEGVSDLRLTVDVLADATSEYPRPITAPVANGTAECQSTLPTPTPPVSQGDTSCDGVVNPLDAALILQLASGLISALPCPGGGDPSGDGVTNPLDAALILQFSAGLISSLPP